MKDIVYVRKYTDKEGNERKEYLNVGYVFEKDGKTSILMKSYINLSVFSDEKGEVWLAVYDHKPKNAKETQPVKKETEQAEAPKNDDEDIPF